LQSYRQLAVRQIVAASLFQNKFHDICILVGAAEASRGLFDLAWESRKHKKVAQEDSPKGRRFSAQPLKAFAASVKIGSQQ
jgi:hypothetical protein